LTSTRNLGSMIVSLRGIFAVIALRALVAPMDVQMMLDNYSMVL
jgi:hypothetical protein